MFNCWHCGFRGGSLAPLMVRGSSEHKEYLAEREDSVAKVIPEKPPCNSLPEGYVPFRLRGDRSEAPYLTYLRSRGLTERTVGLYRMGFVESGFYNGRVVVPSFDQHGMINFWSARSIYPTETRRYVLPQASKDIISNEHMIDWARPVYLVEGIFDEIAIGPQAIALYGKHMLPKLPLRFVERKPPMVYISLDSDARDDAEGLVDRLLAYDVPCAIVDLGEKDPAIAGAQAVAIAAERAVPVSGSVDVMWSRLRGL